MNLLNSGKTRAVVTSDPTIKKIFENMDRMSDLLKEIKNDLGNLVESETDDAGEDSSGIGRSEHEHGGNPN